MNHDEAYARLASLVELRTADEDDGELRAHVEDCSVCQARLETLRQVDRALRSRPAAAEPSERLAERVLAVPRVHRQEAPARARRRLVAAGIGAAAAAIAALALIVSSPWDQGGGAPAVGGFDSVQSAAIDEPTDGVQATIEFGKSTGGVQPVRLTVTGLGGDGRYELWLAGGGGEVAIGTFRPGKDGACTVMMDAPAGEWSAAKIMHAGAEDPGAEVASGPV